MLCSVYLCPFFSVHIIRIILGLPLFTKSKLEQVQHRGLQSGLQFYCLLCHSRKHIKKKSGMKSKMRWTSNMKTRCSSSDTRSWSSVNIAEISNDRAGCRTGRSHLLTQLPTYLRSDPLHAYAQATGRFNLCLIQERLLNELLSVKTEIQMPIAIPCQCWADTLSWETYLLCVPGF